MDFKPSEAQQLLVGTAREFLRRRCPAERVHELVTDPAGLPDELWKEISALGWPGLLVEAAHGGSDGTLLDVVLLVEEMGRACFPGPFIPSAVVATALIRAAGTRAQQERLLPAMAAGDRLCVLALTEESAEFEPDAIGMRGDPGGRLSGRKLFVKDANRAHDLVVVVRGTHGLDLLLIEADRPGIGRVPMETFSGEPLFEVTFDGVQTREGDRLGAAGTGWELLAPALRAGALARGAEMVGMAARLLELAVDYARTRVQSGRPIGSFQAIHHYCADMLRHVDGARYLVYRAAWEIDQGAAAETAVAMAKAHASEACLAVARKAHQIFGAIGYCEEHVLHRYHKRMLAAGLDFGSAAAHLEVVARSIGLQPAGRAGAP